MVLPASGRHTVGLCGSDLYLTPPCPKLAKITGSVTDGRGSGWEGGWVGREAGPPVVGPVQMQATGRLSLTFSL